MNFDQSTHAKCWMFDRESLLDCKENASLVISLTEKGQPSKVKAKNFACGFQQRCLSIPTRKSYMPLHASVDLFSVKMATLDQDILVHFHSHQIQRLVGPNAIFPELRRSASVLSTAIMLFRRFYLSNSVVDFHPRNIGVASALLAVKVDCEPNVNVALLSHATSIVNRKAHKASLCREELRAVSIAEIEEAERNLLAGLDFKLRCHHPYGAIRVLAGEIAASVSKHISYHKVGLVSNANGFHSPHGVRDFYSDTWLGTICERALAVAQSALVYTDVHFLFPPGKIAFAAVAIALEGRVSGGCLGVMMRNYLCKRFPQKTAEELDAFEADVVEIIGEIENCPEINLSKFLATSQRHFSSTAHYQALEVRRVFSVAASFRRLVQCQQVPSNSACFTSQPGKRGREQDYTMCSYQGSFKAARVTPTRTPFLG